MKLERPSPSNLVCMKVMKWEGLKTVVTCVVQELLVLQYDNKLALIQDQIRNHRLLVD